MGPTRVALLLSITLLAKGGPVAQENLQFCITGVPCKVTVRGQDLHRLDRLRIVAYWRNCGESGTSSAVLRGTEAGRAGGDANTSHWTGVMVLRTANYRLCWCEFHHAGPCSRNLEFSMPAGQLVVQGPTQGNRYRPLLGRPFSYTVEGLGLTTDDRIRLVSRTQLCGQSGAEQMTKVVWEDSAPYGPPSTAVGSNIRNLTAIVWEGVIVTSMQELHVCWCPRGECLSGTDFSVELGEVRPRGPVVVRDVAAEPGHPFALRLQADPLSEFHAADRIRIVNIDAECGSNGTDGHADGVEESICWPDCQSSPVSGAPRVESRGSQEVWEPLHISAPGLFSVCWCSNGWGGCNVDEDFLVFVGTIVVAEIPRDYEWHCAAALQPCSLRIPADGGFEAQDHVQLVTISARSACGTSERSSDAGFSRGARVRGFSSELLDGQPAVGFAIGTPSVHGRFRVCYCQQHGRCNQDTDFFNEVGVLTISGTDQQLFLCLVGEPCIIKIKGAGLGVDDALMFLDEASPCAGPHDGSVEGKFTGVHRFRTVGGQPFFLASAVSPDHHFSERDFQLGSGTDFQKHRLCHCVAKFAMNGTCHEYADFRYDAGALVVRGVLGIQTGRCVQGERCEVLLESRQFLQQDQVLLLPYESSCQELASNSSIWWSGPKAPLRIERGDFERDLYAAIYDVTDMLTSESSNYRVCFCAHLEGVRPCLHGATAAPDLQNFAHEVGMVHVTSLLGSVREIVDSSLQSSWGALPATVHAVSVAVDARLAGKRITCVAATSSTLSGVAPRSSDLESCLQGAWPNERCFASEKTTPLSAAGWNLIHVLLNPLLGNATELHVWCYTPEICPGGDCVVPKSSAGTLIRLRRSLQGLVEAKAETVLTAFELRLPISPNFNFGPEWPRVKFVERNRACSSRQPTTVRGVVCSAGADKTCEPPPLKVTGPELVELVWRELRVDSAGEYDLCYCDRRYGATCLLWLKKGSIHIRGPHRGFTFKGNQNALIDISITGLGLDEANRLRVISMGVSCKTELPVQAGKSTLELVDWRSGPPLVSSATLGLWSLQMSTSGDYTVCWCSGALGWGCQAAAGFIEIGTLHLEESVDCIVSEWRQAQNCSRTCGGGHLVYEKDVLQRSRGKGRPCPDSDKLTLHQPCNTEPCPQAHLERAWTVPAPVYPGRPFVVHLEGQRLEPEKDMVMLVPGDSKCGQGKGTASMSCRRSRGLDFRIICGDGLQSIHIDKTGTYHLCFCEGSAAPCAEPSSFAASPLHGATVVVRGSSAHSHASTSTISIVAAVGGVLGGLPAVAAILFLCAFCKRRRSATVAILTSPEAASTGDTQEDSGPHLPEQVGDQEAPASLHTTKHCAVFDAPDSQGVLGLRNLALVGLTPRTAFTQSALALLPPPPPPLSSRQPLPATLNASAEGSPNPPPAPPHPLPILAEPTGQMAQDYSAPDLT